jgi:hypothetical protein
MLHVMHLTVQFCRPDMPYVVERLEEIIAKLEARLQQEQAAAAQ